MLPSTALRAIQPSIRRHVPLQVALVAGLWALGEVTVRTTGLPLPGGLVGLLVLLALLASPRVDARLFARGAHWLIGEMLLFFVPAVMAVTQHHELLGSVGLKLLGAIVGGTVTVMAGTALAVDYCVTRARADAVR